MQSSQAPGLPPAHWGLGVGGLLRHSLRGPQWVRGSPPWTENKLEKTEEAALLSWEIYLKENYLQEQQFQQKQRPEQKIHPWTIQSTEFSRPQYWSEQPFPSPGDLPDSGIEPGSPALQADSL